MPTAANQSDAEPVPSKPSVSRHQTFPPRRFTTRSPRSKSTPKLLRAEVDSRRNQLGYNEVAEQAAHPVRQFLVKFWRVSAWMLELIVVLSSMLRKVSDLAVVGALLVINPVLSFMPERRAARVVEALRRRLQVRAGVRLDSSWLVIPARELVPGDIQQHCDLFEELRMVIHQQKFEAWLSMSSRAAGESGQDRPQRRLPLAELTWRLHRTK